MGKIRYDKGLEARPKRLYLRSDDRPAIGANTFTQLISRDDAI